MRNSVVHIRLRVVWPGPIASPLRSNSKPTLGFLCPVPDRVVDFRGFLPAQQIKRDFCLSCDPRARICVPGGACTRRDWVSAAAPTRHVVDGLQSRVRPAIDVTPQGYGRNGVGDLFPYNRSEYLPVPWWRLARAAPFSAQVFQSHLFPESPPHEPTAADF